ncbi:hypothetical protein A7A09_008330 [Paracoccus methylarcula]|uniref:Uncharacterized protein n=1 Tax=Paracoccus methylarcula TaxID=72022 RepID=A0A422QYC4_9RHOB|nr:hypothetical protein A7A09_008330 [Paracoccus methylarcula]
MIAGLPLAVFAGLGTAFHWGLWNKDDDLPSALIGHAGQGTQPVYRSGRLEPPRDDHATRTHHLANGKMKHDRNI